MDTLGRYHIIICSSLHNLQMVFSECNKAMGYSTLTYLVIESLVIDKVFAQLHACIQVTDDILHHLMILFQRKFSCCISICKRMKTLTVFMNIQVHFGGFPTGDYWLLDTDYENYASVYSCRDVLGLFKFEYAFLLVRTRTPSEEVVSHGLAKQFCLTEILHPVVNTIQFQGLFLIKSALVVFMFKEQNT